MSLNCWQQIAVVEKKAHRGRIWRIMGNEQFTRGMRECFTLKRAEAKRIRDDAAWKNQEGIHGQWQQESPLREILANEDVGRSSEVMRKELFRKQGQQMGRLQRRMQSKREVI